MLVPRSISPPRPLKGWPALRADSRQAGGGFYEGLMVVLALAAALPVLPAVLLVVAQGR